MTTPREDGFAMPAEWAPHQACLMQWPTVTRKDIWAGLFDDARREYAAVARAIAAFEPVIMVTDPGQAGEARDHCGAGIEILPLPIDDSWIRDNGPVFVRGPRGQLALVHFQFSGVPGPADHPGSREGTQPGQRRPSLHHPAGPGGDPGEMSRR